jgi:trehalose 6-phosphate synthase
MGDRRKLIVVSNRGPASYGLDPDGRRVARRGGGGLVTALRGLVGQHEVTWIASAITAEDRAVAAEGAVDEVGHDGSRYRLRLIAHDERAYDWYYNVVSNPVLWFVQHYLWDLAHAPNLDRGLHTAWEHGYTEVNGGFAAAVLEELEREPDAAVFLHDYHLYLAPALVRAARPETQLQHFVHIPWPGADYWHVLPQHIRAALHRGILANDVVGFHTARWRRNFLRTCRDFVPEAAVDFERRTIELDGREIRATVNPISVDPGEFEQLARSPAVRAAEEQLLARRPEKVVLRVDRTDPSKNIVRGFRAFELYLDRHPEMVGRVVMLARLDPSRQEIPEYAEYLGAIQREARRVNDRFESGGWTPIDLRIEDDFPASVAAYKHYDVLLVNAIFDGLNLVAKEAPLVNERDGVLVLSENAGAHDELGDFALTVNPFDVAGQAEAIHAALELPQNERRTWIEGIRTCVREHDIAAWLDLELSALAEGAAARG